MELTANQVSFSYHAKGKIQNVTYSFQSGVLYAIVGKSGSGKTTFLSLLAGLDTPDKGEIFLDGVGFKNMNLDCYRRSSASVIYQHFNLFPFMTVQENVVYPMLLDNIPLSDATKRGQEMLQRVDLGEQFWNRFPETLSGGEQQRVAIARALATQAKIILADEPTGSLDAENTQLILQILQNLAHCENCCVIVVTHDSEVSGVADKTIRMEYGKITEESL